MKTLRIATSLLLTISLLLFNVSKALAEPPPLPSSFYGTVKVNGANVEAETMISAWINGVKYSEKQVMFHEGDSVYALDVPGDILATGDLIEGGVPGDTIEFHIGASIAEQTGTWQSGVNVELNLTATGNQAPVITEGDYVDVTMSEDSDPDPFSLTLHATDADGDTLTWSISTPPEHGTAEASGEGLSMPITYNPNPDYDETDSFVVQVTDGKGGVDSITVTVQITPVNDAPVITGQLLLSTAEETPLRINPNYLIVEDPDNVYPHGFNLLIKPGGNYTIDDVDPFTIVPNLDFNGDLTVPVQVNDGQANSPVYHLTVTVTPVNDAPIIIGQNPLPLSTPEDTPLRILPENLDVIDVDNEYHTGFTLIVGPGDHYSVDYDIINPELNYTGILMVPVQILDPGKAHSAIFDLIVEVRPVNDVPVIIGQEPLSTPEETPLTITLDDLTVTDPDNDYPDDFTLLLQNGENYTFEDTTLTPAQDFNGDLKVPVRVKDGENHSDIFELKVEVTPVNDAPIITEGESIDVSMSRNGTPTPFELTLHATDVDDPDEALTWSISTDPAHGDAVASGTGASQVVEYTPDTDFAGEDSFVVQVEDDEGESDTIIVNVTVVAPNVPPVISEGATTTVTMSEDGDPNPFILTLNATDENEGDTLTWSISTDPENGTASVSGTGTGLSASINYEPKKDYFGEDEFVVQVSDGKGGVDTITVEVIIDAVNDPPEITGQKDLTTDEDVALTVKLTDLIVTDVDNDYPTGFSLTLEDGDHYTFAGATITPAPNFYGELTVPVTVSDGEATSEVYELLVTVNPVNDAPVITGQKTVTTPEETPRTITLADLTVTDVDNPDQSGFTLTLQSGANYTLDGNTLTPALNFNGDLTVPVKVSDGEDSSEVYLLKVTVTPVNDPPVITQGESIEVSMTKNGTPTAFDLTLNATDVDTGDTLTWSISKQAEHGTASASGTGESKVIGYEPNTDYVGQDSFEVQVSDGQGGTDTITVNVNVQATNASPVIAQGASTEVTMSEDGDPDAFELTLSATDADGDPLTWSIVTQPTNGAASISGTGASVDVNYIPTENYHGSDSFTVRVSDGKGGIDTTTVNVTISPVNDDPVIAEGASKTVTMSEDGSPIAFSLTLHATDADSGDTLTWSIKTQAEHGTASVSGTGSPMVVGYIPDDDYNGADTFVVEVSDGNGGTAAITVNVSITAVNDAPVITGHEPLSTPEDTPLTVTLEDLHVEDVDNTYPDDFSLTLEGGANYTFSGATITPAPNFNGELTVPVTVSDGAASSDEYYLKVTVTPVNDAPVITEGESVDVTMSEDGTPIPFDLTLHATDVDTGDTLTWSISTPATHGVAEASGTGTSKAISYTPNTGYAGEDSFVVQVSDGNGGTASIQVNVTIISTNVAPVITEGALTSVSMSEDGSPNPFSLTLHATDADAGDTLTWSLMTPAAHGTAVAAGTGAALAVQYTPDANYHGTDSFVVQVSDGNGGIDTITVNVVISPVNDAPEITEGDAITVTMSQDGTPVPFSLTLHATDVDEGDTLTWTVSQTATHGTASVAATGAVGYVPEAGYSGTDSFEVTVSDGNGGTDTILVNVIIVAAPVEDGAKLYIPVVVKAQ